MNFIGTPGWTAADQAAMDAEQARRDYADNFAAAEHDMAQSDFDVCEHGMSAVLCAGPMHYPADDPNSFYEHCSTSQLMAATSADYHFRGENCPWDCSRCPGNVAADEAEREYYARPIIATITFAGDRKDGSFLVHSVMEGENIAEAARRLAREHGRAVKVTRS